MSIIHGGVAIRDFDMPPAFERCEHHEEIGRAFALVFVIEPRWPPLFHLDRSARFGNQLLRGLVQANQWHIGIAWPRVHTASTSSMAATNALLAFGGMIHCCFRCGLRMFF